MKAVLGFLTLTLVSGTFAQETDPSSGMKIDKHWELVRVHCTGCHSAQQFTRQRGTKRTWQEMIKWMQSSQGLWELGSETESKIIDYLAKNYGPGDAWRRAPLPGNQLPPNPYESDIQRKLRDQPVPESPKTPKTPQE